MRLTRGVLVQCLNVGPYKVNTYIAACPETREGMIIDPGGEDEIIVRAVVDNRIIPRYIINTHGHRDHVQGNTYLSRHFGIPAAVHREDRAFFREKALCADMDLDHQTILKVGGLEIRVIHTPGHTPGSICLGVGGCLFTGDTLFVGGVGRTDLPGGNLGILLASIAKRIMPLPEDTLVYPGHDYGPTPFSTIGREILENIYITDLIQGPDKTV